MHKIKPYIHDVPDFPKKGIIFKDITPLLAHPETFRYVIDRFAAKVAHHHIDGIVSVESRGFILGAALAYKLGVSFIPVRKKGKLPRATISGSYQLEYGVDSLEMHKDVIAHGHNIVVIDDVLATGGTMECVVKMVRSLGGNVNTILFLIELTFLNGREKLKGENVEALVTY